MVSFNKAIRSSMMAIALLALLTAGVAEARDAGTDAIELPDKVVTKKILDNGLTLLARQSPPGGLVAIDIKILAGSSLEGKYLGSGISHLVEHLVFKGTKTRGLGEIEKEVKSLGGYINGSTSTDLTDYHLILPAGYLPEGLAILKDMLLNASFDETELAKEKEVVLKEINMNRDEPQSRLIRRLNETAYLRHSYKFPPIGYEPGLKALTRSDVVEYYETMYTPDRTVVTIVGGPDAADSIAKAEEAFKEFRPPRYASAPAPEAEPAQLGIRRLDEESRTNLAYLAMAFHSTSMLDPDLYALDVLAMILGRGDNSRLNARLVKDARLLYSVSVWNRTPKDPGLFTINAILDRDNADKAETAILEEIEKVKNAPVADRELATAKRMVLADFIDSLQTVDGQADGIGESYILTGSPDFSRRYAEGIQSVTKEQVKAAAVRYLGRSNLSVVRLLPTGYLAERALRTTSTEPDRIRKETLPNGLRILIRRDAKTPAVSITAAMAGGLMVETALDNGISNLTANMLLKGTGKRDETRISGYIEGLGGAITPFSGFNAFGLKLGVLKPDLRAALELLREIITDSTFPQDQIDKEKELVVASIREEDDDIFAVGLNAMRKILYGDSPYSLRRLGEASSVKTLDRDSLVRYADRYCVANNTVISISGDIDPDEVASVCRALFADVKRGDPSIALPDPAGLAKPASRELRMAKEQSLVILGFMTVPVADPDRYTFEVISSVLSGYSGRLFTELRNKNPLAYTLGSFQRSILGTGFFALYVATTDENVVTVRQGLLDELAKVREAGVTDDELARAKRELAGARRIVEQTNDFFAFTGAVDELCGVGYDNLYRYDGAIEKVSNEDIMRVSKKYLDPHAYAEISINPR